MMLIFSGSGTRPARGCDLCLRPMRFLGDHAECRLFRCDDCALVATDDVDARQPQPQVVALSRQIV